MNVLKKQKDRRLPKDVEDMIEGHHIKGTPVEEEAQEMDEAQEQPQTAPEE